MITNLIGSPERSARASPRGANRTPWILAALDAKCRWCTRSLSVCCCLDRPGPPAGTLPAVDWLARLPRLCAQCGSGWVVQGGRQCERCREIQRRSQAGYRAAQTAAGRCLKCSQPATRGKFCQRHARDLSTFTAAWRARCVESGRCQRCPAQAEPGLTACRRCLDARAKEARARRSKRAAAMR